MLEYGVLIETLADVLLQLSFDTNIMVSGWRLNLEYILFQWHFDCLVYNKWYLSYVMFLP